MKISNNFNLSELTKSDTAIKNSISNIPNELETERLLKLVIELIQPLRDKFGKITITSGFRCSQLNKAVGGVETSNHLKGFAADCTFPESNIYAVWEYLKSNPDTLKWTEAGLYKSKNFIHLAYNEDDLKNKMFQR